jgi:hypothetical protein
VNGLPANVIRAKVSSACPMARSFSISWPIAELELFEAEKTELVFIGKGVTAQKS